MSQLIIGNKLTNGLSILTSRGQFSGLKLEKSINDSGISWSENTVYLRLWRQGPQMSSQERIYQNMENY